MGFPTLVRQHHYIESGPRSSQITRPWCSMQIVSHWYSYFHCLSILLCVLILLLQLIIIIENWLVMMPTLSSLVATSDDKVCILTTPLFRDNQIASCHYTPRNEVRGGVYWIHPVRPSVCLSVRPSVRPWVGVRMITLILFSGFKFFFLHISLGSWSCMGLNISVLPH